MAAVAIGWANSGWAESYARVFSGPVRFWIDDGLMAAFFLLAGLEIRREIVEGELATWRRAALPVIAALGGMLVPAVIYAIVNAGHEGAAGWAIPMATDIAFAVGVLALLGARVPSSLRVLLLALAVIDDLGAIVVIAVFYTGGVSLLGLAIAVGGIALAIGLRSANVKALLAYLPAGVVMWIGLHHAGVHPALAGVLLAVVTPRSERMIDVLHPWVAYGVMPAFALANAGIPFGAAELSGDGLRVFLGIVLALAIGKPLGIVGASIAVRSEGPSVRGLTVVGLVGGIGFTMSLFVAQLAFPPGALLDTAKLAILVGSAAAMVLGLAYGAITHRRSSQAS
jgi:Na+:H+ antiporter, NhaA family